MRQLTETIIAFEKLNYILFMFQFKEMTKVLITADIFFKF